MLVPAPPRLDPTLLDVAEHLHRRRCLAVALPAFETSTAGLLLSTMATENSAPDGD